MRQILEGIRVLDFGRYIAGPYCAALLGDLGADVIRVERVEGGEDRTLTRLTPSGEGGLFLQMNRNKRGMTLNTASPEGRGILRRLLETADVVVANYPASALRSMGIDPASVQAINPKVILAISTAYGPGGPYSDRLGFDSVGQAMSGAVYLTGTPDQPYRTLVNYVDVATGTASAMGVLAALIDRSRTGMGQVVEGSLLKSGLVNSNAPLIEQVLVQRDRVAQGNRAFTGAPVDLFKCTDGWIVVQALGQPIFQRWCALMGEDHWLTDPRFADDGVRGENGAEISARMQQWCAPLSREVALERLSVARIPAAPIYSPQQALDDPHIRQTRMLEGVAFPGVDQAVPIVGHPVSLSALDTGIRRRPPLLGEHTDEILKSLDLTESEIDQLKASGIV